MKNDKIHPGHFADLTQETESPNRSTADTPTDSGLFFINWKGDIALKKWIFLWMLSALFFFAPAPAFSHTVTITDPFLISGVGTDFTVDIQHEDASDWKGFINLSVKNTGSEPWGDFHFALFQWQDISIANAFFTGVQSSEKGNGSISVDGHAVDFEFYGSPIGVGDTAWFSLYTDNTTDKASFFGVSFYPTPVPVPAAAWLLGSGLLAMIGLRKRS